MRGLGKEHGPSEAQQQAIERLPFSVPGSDGMFDPLADVRIFFCASCFFRIRDLPWTGWDISMDSWHVSIERLDLKTAKAAGKRPSHHREVDPDVQKGGKLNRLRCWLQVEHDRGQAPHFALRAWNSQLAWHACPFKHTTGSSMSLPEGGPKITRHVARSLLDFAGC